MLIALSSLRMPKRALLLPPLTAPAHGTLHRTPLEGAQLPALRTPPALSFTCRVSCVGRQPGPLRAQDYSFQKKKEQLQWIPLTSPATPPLSPLPLPRPRSRWLLSRSLMACLRRSPRFRRQGGSMGACMRGAHGVVVPIGLFG